MQVKTLQLVAKIASKISNQSSLSGLYRSVELGIEQIRCCSEFGNLEIAIDPTGLTEACLIDTVSVLAVATSLPQDGVIALVKNGNKVDWSCGKAKGHWNIVQSDHKIPQLVHQTYPWHPHENFAQGLLLASSACQAAAVSIGLYGITIEPVGDELVLMSSNSIALAQVKIPKTDYPSGKITMRPPVPGIIAALTAACQKVELDITDDGIFVRGDWLAAHLPLGKNLEHNLIDVTAKFVLQAQEAKVISSELKKFITRARVLADRNTNFTIGLRVEAGKLILEHQGMASSTEELFLAEGLDLAISYKSVVLDASMLLLPLEHIESVVFDYIGNEQLLLKGTNPEFLYILGGA